MHLVLSLTHDCNLACSYCYAGKKSARHMSIATARKAVDYALAQSPAALQISFFGGEPLLGWDVLCRSVDYATYRCRMFDIPLRFSVTTNGILVTEPIAEYFKEHSFSVAVSIDGSKEMHDVNRTFNDGTSSYEATLNGMRRLLSARTNTEAIIVVAPNTVDLLHNGVASLVDTTGIASITINPDVYAVWNSNQLERIAVAYNHLADYFIACYRSGKPLYLSTITNKLHAQIKGGIACGDKCGFGNNEFAVAPSGAIYPCERLIGDDTSDTAKIGSVITGIDKERRARLLHDPADSGESACPECAIASICQHHCGCINLALTGFAANTDGSICCFERAAATAAFRAGEVLFSEQNRWFLHDFYKVINNL